MGKASYKEEFFDKLIKNIQQVADKLTTDGEHHLTRSIENTCHFASALHQTFCDVGDVAGMMGMGASCDFSPIEKESK